MDRSIYVVALSFMTNKQRRPLPNATLTAELATTAVAPSRECKLSICVGDRQTDGRTSTLNVGRCLTSWSERQVRCVRMVYGAAVECDERLNEVDRQRQSSNSDTHVHMICIFHIMYVKRQTSCYSRCDSRHSFTQPSLPFIHCNCKRNPNWTSKSYQKPHQNAPSTVNLPFTKTERITLDLLPKITSHLSHYHRCVCVYFYR